MSSAAQALTKQVGPLPLGVWLLVGAGGLWIARTRGAAEDGREGNTVVREVPVPVGAIASPDDAAVILNPIIYVTTPTPTGASSGGTVTTPNIPTPTPAPAMTAPKPVAVPRPVVKPAAPTSVTAKPVTAKPVRRHTVVSGDTLSRIGTRYGVIWSRIYSHNKAVIEAAARAHGRRDSGGGHWIYPGTVLVIP